MRRTVGWLGVVGLAALTLAACHGSRILANIHTAHWEDQLFFSFDAGHISAWPQCFVNQLWPGLYRPLSTTLYYHVVGWCFGQHVEVYHVLSVLLLTANGVLLFAVARRAGFGTPGAAVALVLFCSRAASSEVVTNTVEAQMLTATFWSFLTLLLLLRGRVTAALVTLGLALLSKESSLVVPAIWLAYAWASGERLTLRQHGAPVAVVGVWAVLHATLFRLATGGRPTGFGYSLDLADVWTNVTAYVLCFANRLATGDPIMPPAVSRSASTQPAQWLVLCLAAATVGVATAARRGRHRNALAPIAWGAAWFFLAIAPVTVFRERLFMRYAYFAHAGLALAAAGVVQAALRGRQALFPAVRAEVDPEGRRAILPRHPRPSGRESLEAGKEPPRAVDPLRTLKGD